MRWERSTHDEAPLEYSPSTDWAQGGPIIEREKIGLTILGLCLGCYVRLMKTTMMML
jgi:hypothetical protein